ncbi:alpha/beta hydrolase family protein [Streptomyces triticirhizae]|uniref:Serine aminopeptidase S33 domain-containing protein n=1 Tax=Streptomyces triticirhizae TaxID=2483353 RepID=A0A3M2L0K5_9ACTN|nr:alpha/beta fold hydrolase [Streptomyces triticirhizae]RMI30476.1 hypothetical protein EBN88_26625 [Streptomyces triticirhizae]
MTDMAADGPEIVLLRDTSRDDLTAPGRPRPVRVHRWRARPGVPSPPLVVVSHGTGGSADAMRWLTGPLAAAGFEVVALDHHGNNHVDGYEPEAFLQVWERARDVTFALDALAAERPLGPVGVAGFSLGGYTAAALVGARLHRAALARVVSGEIPLPPLPEFPDLLAALRARGHGEDLAALLTDCDADLTDRRVRAVFQVAPAMGALLSPERLRSVTVPVEVRWGGADAVTPYEVSVRPYVEHMPTARGRSLGPAVRHDDFFAEAPADPTAAPRAASDAVAFFAARLGSPAAGGRVRARG